MIKQILIKTILIKTIITKLIVHIFCGRGLRPLFQSGCLVINSDIKLRILTLISQFRLCIHLFKMHSDWELNKYREQKPSHNVKVFQRHAPYLSKYILSYIPYTFVHTLLKLVFSMYGRFCVCTRLSGHTLLSHKTSTQSYLSEQQICFLSEQKPWWSDHAAMWALALVHREKGRQKTRCDGKLLIHLLIKGHFLSAIRG